MVGETNWIVESELGGERRVENTIIGARICERKASDRAFLAEQIAHTDRGPMNSDRSEDDRFR
jgi:hypothetical protein